MTDERTARVFDGMLAREIVSFHERRRRWYERVREAGYVYPVTLPTGHAWHYPGEDLRIAGPYVRVRIYRGMETYLFRTVPEALAFMEEWSRW